MFDPEPPELDPEMGEPLSLPAYLDEFRRIRLRPYGGDCWGLEHGTSGRNAAEDESFSRAEVRNYGGMPLQPFDGSEVIEAADIDARHGIRVHRACVVEEPVSPSIQRELHSLDERNDRGIPTRIIPTHRTGPPLPEVMTARGICTYQVRRGSSEVPGTVIRYSSPQLTRAWEYYIQHLYFTAQDIHFYLQRLQQPTPAASVVLASGRDAAPTAGKRETRLARHDITAHQLSA